jgi:diguanylate cyclase (GGDEF)-like protein
LLFAFSFSVCMVLIASYAVGTAHGPAAAEASARREAENLALSLTDQATDTFDSADNVLLTLAQRVRALGSREADRLKLRDDLAEIVATMPRLHRLDVIDAQGHFLVSNISATPDWMPSVADRPYFRYHRSHADRTMRISGPALSRTEHTWVIFATRRFTRSNDVFAGVLIAPIAFDYFEQAYAHVDVGRFGTITLLADDGTVMMRRPPAQIGRSAAHEPLFHDPYRYSMAGWYRVGSGDAVRLVAFRRLGKYPLVVTVALAESEYLHDWYVTAIRAGLTLFVYVAFVLILTVFLTVQLARTSRAEETLARFASVDSLTGLANRREFDIVLDREWRQAVRGSRPIALLMIDVDNFKSYNDAHGHQRGDAVLAAIAGAIAATVRRSTDLPARYGGEEFAVILHDTGGDAALAIAEEVRSAVIDLALAHCGNGPGIASVSIGTASIVPTGLLETSASGLLAAADAALYDAKRAGRNRVCGRVTPYTPN